MYVAQLLYEKPICNDSDMCRKENIWRFVNLCTFHRVVSWMGTNKARGREEQGAKLSNRSSQSPDRCAKTYSTMCLLVPKDKEMPPTHTHVFKHDLIWTKMHHKGTEMPLTCISTEAYLCTDVSVSYAHFLPSAQTCRNTKLHMTHKRRQEYSATTKASFCHHPCEASDDESSPTHPPCVCTMWCVCDPVTVSSDINKIICTKMTTAAAHQSLYWTMTQAGRAQKSLIYKLNRWCVGLCVSIWS